MKKDNFLYLINADIERYSQVFGLSKSNKIIMLLQPRICSVLLMRLARCIYVAKIPVVPKLISIVLFIFFGIEYGLQCNIGPGLILPHPQGIVFGANRIGKNATIYHRVTLGAKKIDQSWDEGLRPVIGDDVLLGSGSAVLGSVQIGNRVQVGANAVVLESIFDDMTAVGNPAIAKKRSK